MLPPSPFATIRGPQGRRWRRAVVAGVLAAACVPVTSAGAQTFTEGWESFPLADWTIKNNSSTLGPSTWMGGADTDAFVAHSGTPDSYVGVNYLSAGGVGSTISTWLISPVLTDLTQGDTVSFYTRTPTRSTNPDRLELRVSTNGSCNPGTTATDVGDFQTLVTSVNPTLERGGYPEAWTKITAAIPARVATTGCLAFRYHVTGAGFGGSNGNFVGIDQLEVTDQPDDVRPDTSFVTTPPVATADNEIWFTYTASPLEGVARIECRLIGPGYPDPAFETCGASAHGWSTLPEGTWTYEIRAVTHGGNVDPTPASYTFTYDVTPPEAMITAGPTGRIGPAGVRFSYASVPEGDATDFECRVSSDGDDALPAFASCDAAGQSYADLADGDYLFEVQAIDAAGNLSEQSASRRFTVDSATPDTRVTGGPGPSVAEGTATFRYEGDAAHGFDEVTGFECRLIGPGDPDPAFDGCPWGELIVPDLVEGDYRFEVRAINSAGNADPVPADLEFSVVFPPTEEPPTEEPSVEHPPTEQPPNEQPATEQPPAEQPPTEQPPGGQPPVPPGEQPPGPPSQQPPGPPA